MRPEAAPLALNRADLVARLGGALDVAQRAISNLLPDGYVDALQPTASVRPEKVISETALLLLKAGAVPNEGNLSARVKSIARRLAPHARSAAMARGMCFEPALALDYGMAHVCLNRLGIEDPAFDRLFRCALEAEAILGRERPPHRALEQCWIAALADMQLPGPGIDTWAGLSTLGSPMDLLGCTREDIYAVTHALMYVSNLPGQTLALPRSVERLTAEVECVLARCLDEEDYDLAGELLLAWPALHAPWTAAARFAMRVMSWVEDQVGFLPCPALRTARANTLDGAERTRYLLATSYHTAFVMGLVSAACLSRTQTMEESACDGDMLSTLDMLPEADRVTHWGRVLQGQAAGENAGLAAFVLLIALHRSYRARDLHRMCELLRVAQSTHVAHLPAWVQAAQLLLRADELGRAVQAQPTGAAGRAEDLRCPQTGGCLGESRGRISMNGTWA